MVDLTVSDSDLDRGIHCWLVRSSQVQRSSGIGGTFMAYHTPPRKFIAIDLDFIESSSRSACRMSFSLQVSRRNSIEPQDYVLANFGHNSRHPVIVNNNVI